MNWKKVAVLVIPAIALAQVTSVGVRADFVTNGSFGTITAGTSGQTSGQLGYQGLTATGWTSLQSNGTSLGYNFLYGPGVADSTGANGNGGNVKLWGPGDGSANGLIASPDGGNFIAADGAYQVGAISQMINGMTVGQSYAVSFDWAGAQQSGYYTPTTEAWTVSLGSQSFTTQSLQNAAEGFTGWVTSTYVFTATSSSELLSFLASGTPGGEPPFSLLDGVSMNAVPEPSSLILAALGMMGFGLLSRRRRRSIVV